MDDTYGFNGIKMYVFRGPCWKNQHRWFVVFWCWSMLVFSSRKSGTTKSAYLFC